MGDERDEEKNARPAVIMQAVIRPAGGKRRDSPISSTVAMPVVPEAHAPLTGETRPSALAMTECPSCYVATPVAKFCSNCGTPLVARRFCSECGAKLVPGGKFCDSCGTKVP